MAFVTSDRILETTTTVGLSAIALAGAVAGYSRFSSIASVGDVVHYMIQELDNVGRPTGAFETGRGTYSAANTLTRVEVVRSSNANKFVEFAAGTKQVAITPLSPSTATVKADWRSMLGLGSTDTIEAAGFKGPLIGKAATAALADRAGVADIATSLLDILPVARGGTGATTPANARAALGLGLVDNVRQVNRGGDTMTGNLAIAPPNAGANFALIKAASGQSTGINSFKGTLARWGVDLGGASPETGNNAGSDFGIYRYADDGNYITTALHINRATGRVTVDGPVETTGQIYSASSIVGVYGFQWTNPLAWGVTSIGYFDEGPYKRVSLINMNSLGGPMQVVGYHRPGVDAMLRFLAFDNTFDMMNNGTGRSAGGWVATSDRRAKGDIRPITGALDKLARLDGYTYLRPDMAGLDGVVPRKAGLIAQEVDDVLPEAVVHGETPDDLLALDYNGVIGLLVASVNELRAEVRALKKKARA